MTICNSFVRNSKRTLFSTMIFKNVSLFVMLLLLLLNKNVGGNVICRKKIAEINECWNAKYFLHNAALFKEVWLKRFYEFK